jgi:ADP-ribosylglycohydrolase
MMLGLAVGDALGITTEGQLPHERRAYHGEISDYLPNKHVHERRGFPSDDTQLAFWTLEQLLADDGLDPDHLAARFCRDHIFGIGGTVRDFIRNYKERGRPWYKAGPRSAGNGALMRMAPVLIPHLRSGSADLWVDTALAAMITHNDSGSIAACLAFVHMLWRLLAIDSPPPSEWWLETYVAVAQELEIDETYRSRAPQFASYRGPIWRFVYEEVGAARRQDLSTLDACNRWYSGAYLMETVPSVIYILMRHSADLEQAVIRAVNDTKDNDTVAAIVGAALGALYGRQAIPTRWLTKLSGRTTDSDDGRIFELLDKARGRWWDA